MGVQRLCGAPGKRAGERPRFFWVVLLFFWWGGPAAGGCNGRVKIGEGGSLLLSLAACAAEGVLCFFGVGVVWRPPGCDARNERRALRVELKQLLDLLELVLLVEVGHEAEPGVDALEVLGGGGCLGDGGREEAASAADEDRAARAARKERGTKRPRPPCAPARPPAASADRVGVRKAGVVRWVASGPRDRLRSARTTVPGSGRARARERRQGPFVARSSARLTMSSSASASPTLQWNEAGTNSWASGDSFMLACVCVAERESERERRKSWCSCFAFARAAVLCVR